MDQDSPLEPRKLIVSGAQIIDNKEYFSYSDDECQVYEDEGEDISQSNACIMMESYKGLQTKSNKILSDSSKNWCKPIPILQNAEFLSKEKEKPSQIELVIKKRFESIQNDVQSNLQEATKVNQQIKQLLTEIDPGVKNQQIDDKLLNFYQEYALIESKQEIHNPQIIKQKQDSTQEVKKKLQQKLTLNNNSNQANSSEVALLSIHEYYKNQGINLYLDDTNSQNESSVTDQYQQQLVTSGITTNLKYLQIKFEDTQELSYSKIQSSEDFKNSTIEKIKQATAASLKIPVDQVIILNIKKGSVYVDIKIKGVDDLNKISADSFKKAGLPQPQLSIKSLLDTFTLSMNIFDPRFNMTWNAGTDTRGQLFMKSLNKYVPHVYQFPAGYTGYGLNVAKWLLSKDQSWLGTDSNAWIVLYHGTGKNTSSIGGILNDTIRPGGANTYGGHQCRITNEIIASGSVNTYLTDDIKVANSYASPLVIGGKKYQIVFQCRVNPIAVRSPTSQPNYYTVESSKYDPKDNIRPYRLLIIGC